MIFCLSSLPARILRAWKTALALRRHDFLSVLKANQLLESFASSACLYAWYRLGCYKKALEMAKVHAPKTARDVVAIAVSSAATGALRQSEDLIIQHLVLLRRNAQCTIEAARGVMKFNPSLALRICEGIAGTADLRAAAHLAAGQDTLAREALDEQQEIARSDLLAGHFFLRANLGGTVEEKLENVNRQLWELGLSEIKLHAEVPVFALDRFRNVPGAVAPNGPLVSVLIPAFNAAAYLHMSARSILEQSYTNLEIIIVNDGSTDATCSVAHEIAASDQRVRVLDFSKNIGAYATRNAAVKEASGTFVTVHDADDFAHRQKIERQVQPLLSDDCIVFSISDLVRVSAGGVLARRDVYPLQRLNTSSLTIRREPVLRECGYWEEGRYGADSEYLFRLKNSYPKDRWVRLRQPLTFAADHSASLTASISTGGVGRPIDPRRIAYTEEYTQRWLRGIM